jgi:hypothetical protein
MNLSDQNEVHLKGKDIMFKLYTKANRLMVANEFSVSPESIICNDVMLPATMDEASRFNPHNVRLWLIGHGHGPVCAIFASHEQDALDAACDANMMESFMISEEDTKAYYDACATNDGEHPEGINYAALGNAGELHDLDDAWIAEVDFDAARDIMLIVKLARAAEGGHDTLDF